MKRVVVLLRHARAESFGIVASDFERTLVPKGVLEAKQTGKTLKKAGFIPDRMIASAAPRAVFTLRIAAAEFGADPEKVQAVQALYDASAQTIMETIQALPDEITKIIICGHNPAISEAAAVLCGSSFETPVLSTAEAIIAEADAEYWAELGRSVFCEMKAYLRSQDRR